MYNDDPLRQRRPHTRTSQVTVWSALDAEFSPNRPTDLEAGRGSVAGSQWRRRGSESSTFACPHGPGAAASSDWTAMKVEFRLLSASRARRAHHFCDRLRLDAKKMVRPTRDARAHGRSRGGPQLVVLSLTVSHACGMLTRLRYLPRMGSPSLRRGACAAALKLPMTRKAASWSSP